MKKNPFEKNPSRSHSSHMAIFAHVLSCLSVAHISNIAFVKGWFLFVQGLTCHDPAAVSNSLSFGFIKCPT